MSPQKSLGSRICNKFDFCIGLMTLYISMRNNIIGFYRLEESVHTMAVNYLLIVSGGLIFTFLNPILSSAFFAKGNSITPFKISIISLVINLILDPFFYIWNLDFSEDGNKGSGLRYCPCSDGI